MSLKLLGVSGSLRDQATVLRALSFLLEAAREFGAETRLLDLRMADLPMFNPDAKPDERVLRAQADVQWAEAFVLASPDYHGSMSGAMKNFLDYHWHEFSGKLFGFVCASNEKGLSVMDGMRVAVCNCYGWSLPYGVSVHGKHDMTIDGRVENPALASRLRMAARDIVTYGSLIHAQFRDDIGKKHADTFASRYVAGESDKY
jgi:NAD(P)H-dependent FMN reductase